MIRGSQNGEGEEDFWEENQQMKDYTEGVLSTICEPMKECTKDVLWGVSVCEQIKECIAGVL